MPPADYRRRVKNGADIIIAKLTRNPNDIRVYGRAIGMEYKPKRDDATAADIQRMICQKDYSRYSRVDLAEFVHGTSENGRGA